MQFIAPALFVGLGLFLFIIIVSVVSLGVIPSEFETRKKKKN